ncbi:MBL fold metallo-hydrolase [Cohnella sp. JJ-181]|uniref:MBL fold metallo-hydrolase n=1 Tax=Cohnella rhizoplanae TaxID=2974897 RepID=UPI0022FF685C|nr:MBL fold metallo-hydrolase [Cohnella sp. JJ-181]CAI6087552.1 putative metallo-hydrolase YflN [Cohnella sp. JJ-181]
MRVTRNNRLYQFTFMMPNFFPVSCYFVEEEDELTLIDAALPHSLKGIMKTAAQIGKPITRIVLTHAHNDHLGALDGLKSKLPDSKVYISERDAKLLKGDATLEPQEHQTPIKGRVPKPGKFMTKPDVLLNDGDRIRSLTAVSSPGHTPGSMSFHDTRSGALLAGDAFQTQGGLAVSGRMKLLFPFPAMATWSKETSVSSARKLLELKPTLLAVGHGAMLEHPQQAVAHAIAEAEKALHDSAGK